MVIFTAVGASAKLVPRAFVSAFRVIYCSLIVNAELVTLSSLTKKFTLHHLILFGAIIVGLGDCILFDTTVRRFLLLKPLDKDDPGFEDPKRFQLLRLYTFAAGVGFILQAASLCVVEYEWKFLDKLSTIEKCNLGFTITLAVLSFWTTGCFIPWSTIPRSTIWSTMWSNIPSRQQPQERFGFEARHRNPTDIEWRSLDYHLRNDKDLYSNREI